MDLIIISADIVSFVFLFVLLCGSLFGSKDGGQSTIWFSCCLLVGLLGTVADAVGYLTVDPSESGSPALPIVRNMPILIISSHFSNLNSKSEPSTIGPISLNIRCSAKEPVENWSMP